MLKILAAIGFLALEVLDVRNAYHLSALALSAHFTSLKQLLSQLDLFKNKKSGQVKPLKP
jgi:hypothetical protein